VSECSTIKCDVRGCEAEHTEEFFNQGHPGWGHIAGIYDDTTGSDRAHLCPAHLKEIMKRLNREADNDMG